MAFGPRHLQVIELVFIAALAYEAALLANTVVSRAIDAPPSLAVAAALESKPRQAGTLDTDRLAPLFGMHAATPSLAITEAGGTPGAIRLTSLHAALEGTTVGTPVELSWAMIRDLDAQRSGVYLLGDPLFDGTLIEVGDGYVLIARPRGTERLELGTAPVPAPPRGDDPPVTTASILERKGTSITLSEAERQHLLANPAIFISEMRVRPHLNDGVLKGFQINWIKPNSIFASTGIMEGDVVSRINGLEMTSVESALGVLSQARTASRMEIEVQRSGQPITYDINVSPQ